jgi:hypothetical protein
MDPVELSMIAVDEDRAAARSFPLLTEQVLTVAGIYGSNASGKSNILEALAWLSQAVAQSLRSWDKIIPREPFRFGDGPDEISRFEVELMVSGVRYAYQLEVDDSAVIFEGLYSYPERRRRVLFEREGLEIGFRRGLGSLAGTRELLTPATLALSAAMRFDEPEVRPFGRRLAGIHALAIGLRQPGFWRTGILPGDPALSTVRLFEKRGQLLPPLFEVPGYDPEDLLQSALTLLRFADLGIDDVQFVETADREVNAVSAGTTESQSRRRPRLVHRVAGQELPFELSEESAGTQTWFALIGPVLNALRGGRILLVDEIDASLHPRLSARLLELFQDPETNPNDAQIIFTTHDTSLLNSLNRDEVWLTERDHDGATTLTALAEYGGDRVRRSLNLERAYMQGRFGAVPELDQLALRRALGVARASE